MLLACLVVAGAGMAQTAPAPEAPATGGFAERLLAWGRQHPQLAASLRRRLAGADPRGDAPARDPEASLGTLQQEVEAWLVAHAGQLTDLEELPETGSQDQLERVLMLRRHLLARVAGPVDQAAGDPDAPGDLLAGAWRGVTGVAGALWSRLVPGAAAPADEPDLVIEPGGPESP